MTIGSKFATLVVAVTSLIVSGILVAAVSIPTTAQKSSGSLSDGDITSSLQSAKMHSLGMHLTEAMKNIKMDNSKAALMQINMTRQAITLAGLKSNATIMCKNIRNEAYCVAP
jgi:hypothetical protein